MTTYTWDGAGGLEIESDDGQTVALDTNDITDLLGVLLDGVCALCETDIPQGSDLCQSCLQNVQVYHHNQFGTKGP